MDLSPTPSSSPTSPTDPDMPAARDPRDRFARLAADCGLVRPGDGIDQNLLDFAQGVVEIAASIGDGYGDDSTGGNAGEHIRAELGTDLGGSAVA